MFIDFGIIDIGYSLKKIWNVFIIYTKYSNTYEIIQYFIILATMHPEVEKKFDLYIFHKRNLNLIMIQIITFNVK